MSSYLTCICHEVHQERGKNLHSISLGATMLKNSPSPSCYVTRGIIESVTRLKILENGTFSCFVHLKI